MTKIRLKRNDLVYPELSYTIVGVLYEVYNQLGSGLNEIAYQRATVVALQQAGLKCKEQVYPPLKFNSEIVGRNYFDFLVEDQIVLEIKKGNKFARAHIQQLYTYLKSGNLKLGILAYFGSNGLHFKRVVNL